MGLEGGIYASRLGFGPQGWGLGREGGIWAWREDLDLKTGIWASRLGFKSGDGWTEKKEKEKEKITHMYESIGHRPLQGRCPKRKLIFYLCYK